MNEVKDKIESFFNEIGTASFNVKFNDTPENWTIVTDFKKYCKENTQNGYLMGIKKLLDYMSYDWKYASLFDMIQALNEDLLELETKIKGLKKELEEKPKEKQINTFGGDKNE